MPLSPIELDYEAIYSACAVSSFDSLSWVDRSLDYGTSSDPFSHVFHIDKSLLEIMTSDYVSCDEHHHRSSLPNSIEDNLSDVYSSNSVELCVHPIIVVDPFAK